MGTCMIVYTCIFLSLVVAVYSAGRGVTAVPSHNPSSSKLHKYPKVKGRVVVRPAACAHYAHHDLARARDRDRDAAFPIAYIPNER